MADFHQTGSIATIHRLRQGRLAHIESELEKCARHTGISLILPALISEFERPAMRRIADQLRSARYFSNIVVAIGRATRHQVEQAAHFFRGFRSPVTILWIEDPRIQEIFGELNRIGLPANLDGKGRTCWLSLGYLLSQGQSDVIALHDCDIVNYNPEIPAALCYPLAHPRLDFDFCKGYYARISEKLHGRVSRLFLSPLLESVHEHAPNSPFLNFLREFRYPLAGEFAMKAGLARNLCFPSDWGLEIGVLAEVFRLSGPARACQADLADNYEHKHQELSPRDPSKGLRRMTFDIAGALLRSGLPLAPSQWLDVARDYSHYAGHKVRQYEADAIMNGLSYDRDEEIHAVNCFGDSLHEAITLAGAPAAELPSWSSVARLAPGLFRRLLDCSFQPSPSVPVAMPNWVQPAPLPASLVPVP
jgi:glucosyl-3-phosphoglycerate synthase